MSIGTLPPSLPSRHASLPSPFSLLPTPISPRVETSHHVVTSARDSAPVVAPSPVASPDAMMSSATLEDLDFEPQCDALTRSGDRCPTAAWAVVVHLCHDCRDGESLCCRPCWERASAVGWTCTCGRRMPGRYIRVKSVIR